MKTHSHRWAASIAALVWALVWAPASPAQELEPIRYSLSFPAPHTHYVDVRATVPTEGRAQIELMMPVWTPGSYLVREFSRHVESMTARGANDAPLAVEKTRKNRWKVVTGGARTVALAYRVYGRELSVRTNWIDDRFALLNGAPTFITLVDARARAHEVALTLPPGWSRALTSLPVVAEGTQRYRAPDYDTLVDSPIVAGNPAVYEFEAGGKPHFLVNIGESSVWDGKRAAQDLEKIVRQTQHLWGSVPYDRYLFFNVIGGPGNGLEHKSSTVLMTGRQSTQTRQGYLGWLSLASHEYFHAWNVKRLRPIELGPFDYENEVYTRSLWFAEGVTDYYADLQVHRAGISTRDEYISSLSGQIAQLQSTPGRLVQPVESASYDAWIKYYRPDENSANTSVSYYVKGAVIGFLMDAKIRRATAGTKTLDDLLRALYERYSGARGFTPQDLRATAAEVAGPAGRDDFSRWFVKVLETVEELDYSEALEWFGLHSQPVTGAPGAALGLATRIDNGRTIVVRVRRGTPSFDAGFDAEDELLAIDDVPIPAGQLDARIAQFQPGDRVTVLVSRREELRRIDVTLGADVAQGSLEIRSDASSEQSERLRSWLGN